MLLFDFSGICNFLRQFEFPLSNQRKWESGWDWRRCGLIQPAGAISDCVLTEIQSNCSRFWDSEAGFVVIAEVVALQWF